MLFDEKMLLFHDCQLYNHDLESLRNQKWITDSIIEYHCELLENELFPNSTFAFVKPALVFLISSSSLSPLELSSMLGPVLNNKSVIFLPINDGVEGASGSHWSLLIFSRPENTFFYYDSMGTSGIEWVARKNLKRIMGALQIQDGVNFKVMETPQQQNGYDCGAFVLRLTLYFAQKLQARGYDLLQTRQDGIWQVNNQQITSKEVQIYREYLFVDISKRVAKYKTR